MARLLIIACGVVLAGCSAASESAEVAAPPTATESNAAASDQTTMDEKAVVLDCSSRSMADFGDAFNDARNLVVGPLVLVGAAVPTSEAVVLAHDGQKFPALVKAGHTVTIDVPSEVRKTAGLAYGPFPDGRIKVSQAHDRITFEACPRDEPSGSTAPGPVTFWSGFVMTSVPTCLPLDVYVDDERAPRRVVIALGKDPCPGA